MERRTVLAASAVIIVIVVIAAGGAFLYPALISPPPVAPKVFRWGMKADPSLWDPYREVTTSTCAVYSLVYETMTRLWPDPTTGELKIYPRLAERWEQKDPTTWIFYLRKGAKFHSGNEVTARDVEWSFMRAITWTNITFPSRSYWIGVKEVKAVDRYTVEFKTDGPYGPFLNSISVFYTPVIEAALGWKPEFGVSALSCGAGPFRLVEYVRGERYVVERFNDYWDKNNLPKVDKIIIRPVGDDAARVLAFEAGEFDAIEKPSPADVDRLRGKGHIVDILPETRIIFFHANVQKPPFDDARVRLAASLAIDRAAICKNVLWGLMGPPKGIIGMGAFGALNIESKLGKPPFPYDPDRARQLLKETGYKGEEIVVWTSSGRYLADRQVVEAVQAYLKAVGFNVKVEAMEWGTYYGKMGTEIMPAYFKGQLKAKDVPFHLCLWGWANPAGDLDASTPLWSNSGAWHMTFWEDPRLDELLVKARSTTNSADRIRYYEELQMMVYDKTAYIPTHTESSIVAMRGNVRGLTYYLEEVNMRNVWFSS